MPIELDSNTCALEGISIVEAGAGTGKTYTIQKLVLRLILEKRIPLPKILVVTFTVAATGELLDRLHAILQLAQEAIAKCRETKSLTCLDDKHYGQIGEILKNKQKSDPDFSESRRLVQDALQDYDQAAVMTIHGFCQRMLLENAFASHLRYGVEVRTDISELKKTIAMDFLRKLFYNPAGSQAPDALSPDELLNKVGVALSNAYNDAKIFWGEKQFSKTEKEELLNKICQESFWQTPGCPLHSCSAIEPGRKYLTKKGVSSFSELASKLVKAIGEGKKSYVWRMCLELADDKFGNNLSRGQWAGFARLTQYSDFFKTIAQVAACTDQFGTEFLDFYKEELQRYKSEEGFLTFDDLIYKMKEIVIRPEGDGLRQTIRETFPFVFVDEFQDTDPCQFAIFSKIFETTHGGTVASDHGFFMIGDPKQAIYSFRGGDLDAYLLARNGATNSYTLTKNFRSGKKYIEALNTFYSAQRSPFDRSEIDCPKIEYGGTNEADLYQDGRLVEKPLQFYPVGNQDEVALWTVIKILELLAPEKKYALGTSENDLRPVLASDIAVLFPVKKKGGELEKMLNQEGIDTIWMSESDIFLKPEAKTIWRFLKMLYGGARQGDMAEVLLDRLFMCTETELKTFQKEVNSASGAPEDSPCVLAQKYFCELRDLWEKKGIYAMFQKFLYGTNQEERPWLCKIRDVDANGIVTHFGDTDSLAMHIVQSDKVNGRYVFGHIRQLVDKLHRASKKRQLTPGRLLAYLEGMINEDKDLEDSGMEHNVQRNTDAPAVRLMTLHSSKGLEFPIVFLPDVPTHENKNNPNRIFHDANDKQKRSVDMSGWLSGGNRKYKEACEKEFLQEKLRLLYVGVTRAEYACFVPYRKNRCYTGVTDKLEKDGLLEALKAEEVSSHGLSYTPPVENAVDTGAREFNGQPIWDWRAESFSGFKGGFQNVLPKETPTPSASKPMGGDDEKDEEAEIAPTPEGGVILGGTSTGSLPGDDAQAAIFSFAAGTDAGTLWHEIFEKMSFQPTGMSPKKKCFDDKTEGALVAQLETQSLYEAIRLRRNDDDERHRRDLAFSRMLKGLLCNPMGMAGEQFSLNDIIPEKRASELRFLYVLKNNVTLKDIKACLDKHGILTTDWAQNATANYLDHGLTGSLDLLCQASSGKYYIVDWKTNSLSRAMENFSQDGMQREIDKKFYTLQYLLYTVAFWHYIHERQRIELTEDNYKNLFGGVLYLFVRGIAAPLETMSPAEQEECAKRGIYYNLPKFELIQELKELLDIRSAI